MKPSPEEQERIIEAEALSRRHQQEIEFVLFDAGDEVDEERYRELKDGQHAVNRYLRTHGIDGA